jgi:hypothetical protein
MGGSVPVIWPDLVEGEGGGFPEELHYYGGPRAFSPRTFLKFSLSEWVVPEKIHTPPTEEISAVQRGRGEKIVSDNSKCIRTSEGGRGVNFLFPPWGWYGCFLE